MKEPKMAEVAERICQHLKRCEADPAINTRMKCGGLSRFWHAHAYAGGSRVMVCYISFQGFVSLSKREALVYLQWLDAGNSGRYARGG